MSEWKKAFAPASVGNVGIGFDILGHVIAGVGDTVSVRRLESREVRIGAIRGVVVDLPGHAAANTAGAALLAMQESLDLPFGFEVEIDKGIPLGSGMGGSAASCVAALVAANALLDAPLSREGLYPFALVGEAVASGGRHGDNIGPMLLGGLVLSTADRLVRIPVPQEWHCVLVHPDAVLQTRLARKVLQGSYELGDFVTQSGNLALVLAGCYAGDAALVRAGLRDVLVEPRRAHLIKGFAEAKRAALDAGAMGASISGAGPSVFGWFESCAEAEVAAPRICAAFAEAGFESQSWISPIGSPAASLLPPGEGKRGVPSRTGIPMKFISTRNRSPAVTLSQAIIAGLAPDGGLYVPESMPAARTLRPGDDIAATAAELLAPFFAGDALEPELSAICAAAFDFPAPLLPLATPGDHVLELFHGPTAAFKDFGARFLAQCLSRIRAADSPPLTILVATSGDTGAAVAAAFHRQPGLRVVVLYPDGRVSPRQAHQLGCFGDNVTALKVDGTFDDCQALVKQALGDMPLQQHVPLSSANSISLGRLLPQMSYYAHASLQHQETTGRALNFVIPTGNLGNAVAAIMARALGTPLGRIVLATNANDVLPWYFSGAEYQPGPSVATLANAMDVGAPSNFERMLWLYAHDARALRSAFDAVSVDDGQIMRTIGERYRTHGEVFCPHTATAVKVLEDLRSAGIAGDWAVAATAHPAKFEGVVEPLVGAVALPASLAALLQRPASAQAIPADYPAFRELLLRHALD